MVRVTSSLSVQIVILEESVLEAETSLLALSPLLVVEINVSSLSKRTQ